MSAGKHCIKTHPQYKRAAKIAGLVKEGKDSLKNLIYKERSIDIKPVYKLVVETFKHQNAIDKLIKESNFLTNETFLIEKEPWLTKILIFELLWGKKRFTGKISKPIERVLSYENSFKEILSSSSDLAKDIVKEVIKPRWARVNTLLMSTEDAIEKFREEEWTLKPYFDKNNYAGFLESVSEMRPDEFMVDLHVTDLLVFPPKTEFFAHPAYKASKIILQDKASCLPVQILNPPPGSVVLDMCAAPGMKTTQAAAMLKNQGTVYACEVDAKRCKILQERIEQSGATCVKIITKDVLTLRNDECPDVEYILVDPSCTGSGITNRLEVQEPNSDREVQRMNKLCNFQAKLLRHALLRFPNAKRVVYSTCSINAAENEFVVREVLETTNNYKLIDARKALKGGWNDLTSETSPQLGNMCIYALPENDQTNGFFVAAFERLGEGEKNPYLNVELMKMFSKAGKEEKGNNRSNGNAGGNTEFSEKKNKKKCKLLEDGNENIENEAFENNRKKRKCKQSGVKENESSEEINTIKENEQLHLDKNDSNENIKNELLESANKKKKHKNLKDTESGDKENESSGEISAMKKKTKKKNLELNENDGNVNIKNELLENVSKKKKHKNLEDAESGDKDNKLSEEISAIKKKQKNKNLELDENDGNENIKNELIENVGKKQKHKNLDNEESVGKENKLSEKIRGIKKKKKHKSLELEENDCNENTKNELLEIATKNKKHQNLQDADDVGKENESSEEIGAIRKKQKDKNLHLDENNCNENIKNEMLENVSKKKKHKNSEDAKRGEKENKFSDETSANMKKHKNKNLHLDQNNSNENIKNDLFEIATEKIKYDENSKSILENVSKKKKKKKDKDLNSEIVKEFEENVHEDNSVKKKRRKDFISENCNDKSILEETVQSNEVDLKTKKKRSGSETITDVPKKKKKKSKGDI